MVTIFCGHVNIEAFASHGHYLDGQNEDDAEVSDEE